MTTLQSSFTRDLFTKITQAYQIPYVNQTDTGRISIIDFFTSSNSRMGQHRLEVNTETETASITFCLASDRNIAQAIFGSAGSVIHVFPDDDNDKYTRIAREKLGIPNVSVITSNRAREELLIELTNAPDGTFEAIDFIMQGSQFRSVHPAAVA